MKAIYTDADRDWIIENLKNVGYEGAAKHMGVSVPAIKARITTWRNNGVQIPFLKSQDIGARTVRNERGIFYEYEKIGKARWRRIRCVSPPVRVAKPVTPKQAKPPKLKKVKEPVKHVTMRKLPEKEKPVRIPLPFDPALHIMVKIDNKTWKQVKRTA